MGLGVVKVCLRGQLFEVLCSTPPPSWALVTQPTLVADAWTLVLLQGVVHVGR